MRKTKVLGMGLVAAFALSAVIGVSGASATVGYYKCAAQKKGEYTTSTCATKSVKAKKGKFELVPLSTCVAQKKGEYTNATCTTKSVKAKKGKFEKAPAVKLTATTGTATLATPAFGPNNVVCSASTTTGELTGPKTAIEKAVFTGCEVLGLKCKSAGPNSVPSSKEGEIDVATLSGTLLETGEAGSGFKKEKPPAGQAWNQLITTGEHGVYSSEFECGGGAVAIRTTQNPSVGSALSGLTLPVNKAPSTTGEVVFNAENAEQALLTQTLSGGEWVPPTGAPSTETTTATVTFSTPIEVKA